MKEATFISLAPQLRNAAYKASRSAGASEAEAEDIAQDAMLRFWQMKDELERFHSLEAVARRMAYHLTINLHRKSKPLAIDGEKVAAKVQDDRLSPDEALEEKEAIMWLEERISQLPTTEHTILYMRQVEKRSAEEIAQRLGIAATSVSTLLSRARKRLLEEIKRRR